MGVIGVSVCNNLKSSLTVGLLSSAGDFRKHLLCPASHGAAGFSRHDRNNIIIGCEISMLPSITSSPVNNVGKYGLGGFHSLTCHGSRVVRTFMGHRHAAALPRGPDIT